MPKILHSLLPKSLHFWLPFTRELPLSCMEKLADLYGCDAYMLYEENESVIEDMLATAFRVDNLSPADMEQIAAFKRVVKNSLMMDKMLSK